MGGLLCLQERVVFLFAHLPFRKPRLRDEGLGDGTPVCEPLWQAGLALQVHFPAVKSLTNDVWCVYVCERESVSVCVNGLCLASGWALCEASAS